MHLCHMITPWNCLRNAKPRLPLELHVEETNNRIDYRKKNRSIYKSTISQRNGGRVSIDLRMRPSTLPTNIYVKGRLSGRYYVVIIIICIPLVATNGTMFFNRTQLSKVADDQSTPLFEPQLIHQNGFSG